MNEQRDPKKYRTILSDIRENTSKKPAVVAIAGFGGSGKTTLAKQLEDDIEGSVIIQLDDFMVNHLNQRGADWEGFDWQRLNREVLEPIVKGNTSFRYGVYDWDTNSVGSHRSVNDFSVVILEGVGLLKKDLMDFYNYSIWIQCPIEVAYQRGLGRETYEDHHEHWLGIWLPNDLDYFVKHQPHLLADAVYSTI